MIPPDDRGFTLGDGVFETVLAEEGSLVFWDEHVARLCSACETLGLQAPDPDELLGEARAALSGRGLERARAAVRLSWTAGSGGRGLDRPGVPTPRLVATAAASAASSQPMRLATADVRRNERSPASRLKTMSYLDNVLARREAQAQGADEALMLNTCDEVACAGAANLFWLKEGRLFTPALDCGVLPGVVRQVVLGAFDVAEVRADLDELRAAEAAWLTNSLLGVRDVQAIDGRALAASELTEALAASIEAAARLSRR